MNERRLIAAAALLASAASSPAVAADSPAVAANSTAVAAGTPLEPLAFLAGNCWATVIEASKETDTHCYEWMHGGQQLHDRHVVRGPNPDYAGETVYAYNGERKRVEYRYWNSIGGLSDGYVEVAADGTLRFLDDRYVGPDGVAYVFASEMTRPQDGEYRMVSRFKEGEDWREMWSRRFERLETPMTPVQPVEE